VAVKYSETSYSGPVPPAAELRAIDEVVPGAAERIIGMAERDIAHQAMIERLAAETEARDTREGRIASVAVPVCGMATGLVIALLGAPAAGAGVCCAALLPNLAAVLLRRR
jgi:uncharacterized membrane protein